MEIQFVSRIRGMAAFEGVERARSRRSPTTSQRVRAVARMSVVPTAPPRSGASRLRRVIVGVIVVSFSLAALGGIVVLLGGDLGEPAGKVLATTAAVGAFSIAVLCCAALVGRRIQVFGLIGAAVSVLTLVLLLVIIWAGFSSDEWWDVLVRAVFTGIAATVAFSLASLLLLLSDRRRGAVRWGLWITLGLFAVVLLMIWYLIWWSDTISGDAFARVLGVLSILAALGAVIVPVMSLLLPDQRRADDPSSPHISPELAQRLRAEASRRGVTVEDLVAPVFENPLPPTA